MKICILMRGIVACGKTTTAKKLVGDGIICETDEYFYTKVGDDPTKFDYDKNLRWRAREWNFNNFKNAINNDVTPVIVDRGHTKIEEIKSYAQYAYDNGYVLEIKEPDSSWWTEVKEVLRKKDKQEIYDWAIKLAAISKPIHDVRAWKIRQRMMQWENDVTIKDILGVRNAT